MTISLTRPTISGVFLQRIGEIGHAADGDDGHLARIGTHRLDDEAVSRAWVGMNIRHLGHADIAKPVIAMDEFRWLMADPMREEGLAGAA